MCHIAVDDLEFCRVAQKDGWDLMCQPPNSPDLNVLDLGFFTTLQAYCLKSHHRQTSKKLNLM
jgi:hypothetical protein